MAFWSRVAKCQTQASAGASASTQGESQMRTIITVAAMALSLGLVGIQTSSAAPANGTVIQSAAD